ncbi:MAG: hypothetical protein RL223_3449, partial [Pseudomonadota bacterium]
MGIGFGGSPAWPGSPGMSRLVVLRLASENLGSSLEPIPKRTMTDAASRPRLNRIAGPILGEFLIGMTVAMAGLWLASNESDAAAGAFGLSQQVLETLFVLFRVLAIGVGAGVTQALGAQRPQAAGSTALVGLGASTWAGVIAAGVVLFGSDAVLGLLNAPAAVAQLAGPYLQLLALALLLEAFNLTMAATLRAH